MSYTFLTVTVLRVVWIGWTQNSKLNMTQQVEHKERLFRQNKWKYNSSEIETQGAELSFSGGCHRQLFLYQIEDKRILINKVNMGMLPPLYQSCQKSANLCKSVVVVLSFCHGPWKWINKLTEMIMACLWSFDKRSESI